MIDIEEFKETIGVKELPDESRIGYQTLAGFILSQTGSIPSAGFCFDWNGFHFEIVDMDGLRIDRVFVSRIEAEETAETESGGQDSEKTAEADADGKEKSDS
jgi:putative hemolysin